MSEGITQEFRGLIKTLSDSHAPTGERTKAVNDLTKAIHANERIEQILEKHFVESDKIKQKTTGKEKQSKIHDLTEETVSKLKQGESGITNDYVAKSLIDAARNAGFHRFKSKVKKTTEEVATAKTQVAGWKQQVTDLRKEAGIQKDLRKEAVKQKVETFAKAHVEKQKALKKDVAALEKEHETEKEQIRDVTKKMSDFLRLGIEHFLPRKEEKNAGEDLLKVLDRQCKLFQQDKFKGEALDEFLTSVKNIVVQRNQQGTLPDSMREKLEEIIEFVRLTPDERAQKIEQGIKSIESQREQIEAHKEYQPKEAFTKTFLLVATCATLIYSLDLYYFLENAHRRKEGYEAVELPAGWNITNALTTAGVFDQLEIVDVTSKIKDATTLIKKAWGKIKGE
jgi:hypothetical protein